MRVLQTTLVACLLVSATAAFAQESGIRVRSVRVLATDPEAIATFYKKAFGMSETRRVGDTPGSTFKEIILNTGSTPDLAKKSKVNYALLPAAAIALAIPGFIGFVWAEGMWAKLAFLAIPTFLNIFYLAPALVGVAGAVHDGGSNPICYNQILRSQRLGCARRPPRFRGGRCH